jgi:midasin
MFSYSDRAPDNSQHQPEPQVGDSRNTGTASTGLQQGSAPSQPGLQLSANPLRSLGDALKEIRQRFDHILDAQDQDTEQMQPGEATQPLQLEYVLPDDTDHDMQALGPAGEEQVAKLKELKLIDDENTPTDGAAPMDIEHPSEPMQNEQQREKLTSNNNIAAERSPDNEGAITDNDIRSRDSAAYGMLPKPTATETDVEMEDIEEKDVEAELRHWQADGLPSDEGERIWRLYESLTHDLAYALCEQLRLILEPTLATRLKGDYRAGKRLNMKKIISYIASDYTKDKIWLRRTRPSQREYQILIALDDSKSMAESHSVHLAYETLALVSKALSRLEAGDIGIAKFGERVDILHGFDEGPFTDQAGTKIMTAFHFNQKATNVLSLVETSLQVLEKAREHRSMSSTSAADLWQLEIIISDGICQDHDQLRTVLRKAEEQRVMIVFIVIDSLQSGVTTSSTPANTTSSSRDLAQNSILSMKQVSYKIVDGRMETQVDRYLDLFPFEYFVVLRNVEALPEVLSGTLKQFFERISEE